MDGRLSIALAAILWGTTGTSQALAPQQATPLAIGALRLLVGGSALLLYAQFSGQLRFSRNWLRPVIGVACLSTACYQLFFFAGVSLTGVAVGTLVAIGSAPIFAGVLGAVVHQERLSRRWWSATLLAVIGCSCLALSGGEADTVNLSGILLSLGAGLSYAIFATANKSLLAHLQSTEAMAISFAGGALLLLPILFFTDLAWVGSINGLLVVGHLGLLATGLSYFLFGQGLRTVSVAVAGTLSLIEPLTATLLSVFLLSEPLTPLSVLGVLVLFSGLLMLVLPTPHKFLSKSNQNKPS